MKYYFNEIEAKWQKYWKDKGTFHASNSSDKPKYYVLDMFPYPSGAGLHVGHPLGYIASDVYARYKRLKGFNVLHPQGYDSFGLPAEQYAIQTGQHPAVTTKVNIEGGVDNKNNEIAGYRKQLDKIGFSFDWSREVRTSDPQYYKWTQWIFTELFNSWYNNDTDQAEGIDTLVSAFAKAGNASINAACDDGIDIFTATEWAAFSEKEQQDILLKYRLTYLAVTEVNWCPALGTVLANDEIVNGVSERGGHPVIRKKMTQWSMRISAYAERLLQSLEKLDWSESIKEVQRNWIGKSVGATVTFPLAPKGGAPAKFLTGGNNAKLLLERAKEMRNNPTPAEAALWESLRSKNLGDKFRRQHPVDEFIPDFVCLSKKLILEVDGDIHDSQIEEDQARTDVLEKLGYKVLRFRNEQVLGDLESVLDTIKKELDQREKLPLGAGGISVFTTRPDTIFGVSFMTLAPELDLVREITTPEQRAEVDAYIEATAKRSERERMADVKTISGAFTGAYAEHPFTKEPIPIWIGDYVLAGYGTGAVMAVPCGDQRDYEFAKKFGIAIPNVFEGVDISEEAFSDKATTVIANSDFLNGLPYKKAVKTAIYELEKIGAGSGKINYRLRDAVFSRQRYWGEPFPVYYKDGMPQMIDDAHLPLELPKIEKYLPTETGEPPLGRADIWAWDITKNEVVANDLVNGETVFPLELNTMPGWAGSSWYFFRYMEKSQRDQVFASKEALDYWENVDLYIGGSEHGTGHLLYSRFWVKFLKDRGHVPVDEPFKKMINQGMILGESAFAKSILVFCSYEPRENLKKFHPIKIRLNFVSKNTVQDTEDVFFDKGLEESVLEGIRKDLPHNFDTIFGKDNFISNIIKNKTENEIIDYLKDRLHFKSIKVPVDVDFIEGNDKLNIEKFVAWRAENKSALFQFEEDGTFRVFREVEKMSKSKYNVVNPDQICEQYGADTLRMYEMFLGPLEQAKPWNTAGITGVHSFLKKFWKLYHSPSAPKGETPTQTHEDGFYVSSEPASKEALKTLHKTIKKVADDIENFSFNTSVSTFMIAVNELGAMKCNTREILEPLAILIAPYAPHIAEELWEKLGHTESISEASFPIFDAKHLVESVKNYPISFNGKMKFTLELSLDLSKDEIQKVVMAHGKTQMFLDGRTPKKVIVVPGKIVNIVG